jgi:hypothetical protein
MATAIEQLEAMRCLGDNWDGYGAAAPQATAIDLAQEFVGLLEALLSKSTAQPCTLHVSPTRVGGVLIEWEDPLKQHEVEINPDSSIGFLHLNRATGQMETRKFTPDTQTVVHPGFLQELSQLLAA